MWLSNGKPKRTKRQNKFWKLDEFQDNNGNNAAQHNERSDQSVENEERKMHWQLVTAHWWTFVFQSRKMLERESYNPDNF